MKTRIGFVSNSSSSSFMIPKSRINYAQAQLVLGFPGSDDDEDGWTIYEDGDCIRGVTIMDNDAFGRWMEKVGFPENVIEWSNW